jgi:parvulin-like peptidyl-prolyl isomerase
MIGRICSHRHLIVLACAGSCALLPACGEKETGPKRADDKAAHTARYHPQVDRSGSQEDDTSAAASPPQTQPTPSLETGPLGTPILFVNGDALTVQDILEPIMEDLRRQAAVLDLEDYRNYLLRMVADEIRNQTRLTVVYQKAKDFYPEQAQQVLDERADDVIRDVINRRFGGVHARYEAHLKSFGFSLEDMKERARRQVIVTQFLRDRFLPRLEEPSRRDLVRYYEAHLDSFTTPASAEMFLLDIPLESELGEPVDEANAEEITAARHRAREQLSRAREELESGVEFEAVAGRYSKGIRSAVGGAWGEIRPGSLTGRWARAAEVLFTLDEGQLSDVIETEDAVMLVQCGRKTPAERLSFEEAQTRIIERIKDEQYQRLTGEYVSRLLREATIDQQQGQEFLMAVAAAAPLPELKEVARNDRKQEP